MTKKDEKSIPAAQVQVTGTPILFDAPVKITRLDGSVREITLKLRVMRRTEWAKLRDGLEKSATAESDKVLSEAVEGAKEQEAAAQAEDKTPEIGFFQRMACSGYERLAEVALKAVVGWSEPEPLSIEALVDLDDREVGALATILHTIDAALFRGRVGN